MSHVHVVEWQQGRAVGQDLLLHASSTVELWLFLMGTRGGNVDQPARMNGLGDAAVVLLKSKCRGMGA